jgi:hypothetical protein
MFQLPSLAGDALAPFPAALPSCTGPPSLGAPCTASHVEHSQHGHWRTCTVPCNGMLRRDRSGYAGARGAPAAEADSWLRSSPASPPARPHLRLPHEIGRLRPACLMRTRGQWFQALVTWRSNSRGLMLIAHYPYRGDCELEAYACHLVVHTGPLTVAHALGPNLPKSPFRPNTFCSLVCPSNLPLWAPRRPKLPKSSR